ncbi:hypothetical protein [Candidatus Protochlamydia phocaeensis]|uniref:hypothetical protein n=1 Tax=Candidatus Protochlamydia phocaeensis TaxID=1414722 RepID=UPI0008387E57|nr:hypothetical protein [Candidatus Protochlamydia phocaeensis]
MTVYNDKDSFLKTFMPFLEKEGRELAKQNPILGQVDEKIITNLVHSILSPEAVREKEIGNCIGQILNGFKESITENLSAKEARQFEKFWQQEKSKGNIHKRFYSKKSANLIKAELDQDLNLGIKNLLATLSTAEERRCHPKDITEEAFKMSQAQKADQMMEKLIKEEQAVHKKGQQKEAKKKQAKTNKQQTMQKPSAPAPSQIHSKAVVLLDREDKPSSSAQVAKYSNLAIRLCHPSLDCPEYSRVRRWKTKNPGEIRFFIDHDAEGKQILRYRDLTDEQILEQRARHFLPGIERLLKDPQICKIYGFPTDRGYGLIAQLYFNQNYHNGVIYFGVDERNAIFHKYFEERQFSDVKKNIFLDEQQENIERALEENEREGEWKSNQDFTIDISDKGVFKFTYSSDHYISIFPIQTDLLHKIYP